MGKTGFFWDKSQWKDDIYWFLKSFLFKLFGNGKYSLFWDKKFDEKMIFTDYWKVFVLGNRKVLVLEFSVMGNTLFSQKVDVKIIFTWFFWAFHDIPGPGKYSFSCSGHTGFRINIWRLSQECINWTFLKILKLLSKILISHTRFQINI